jgi:hypothetical protein
MGHPQGNQSAITFSPGKQKRGFTPSLLNVMWNYRTTSVLRGVSGGR